VGKGAGVRGKERGRGKGAGGGKGGGAGGGEGGEGGGEMGEGIHVIHTYQLGGVYQNVEQWQELWREREREATCPTFYSRTQNNVKNNTCHTYMPAGR
jgi:hypothetical protein